MTICRSQIELNCIIVKYQLSSKQYYNYFYHSWIVNRSVDNTIRNVGIIIIIIILLSLIIHSISTNKLNYISLNRIVKSKPFPIGLYLRVCDIIQSNLMYESVYRSPHIIIIIVIGSIYQSNQYFLLYHMDYNYCHHDHHYELSLLMLTWN